MGCSGVVVRFKVQEERLDQVIGSIDHCLAEFAPGPDLVWEYRVDVERKNWARSASGEILVSSWEADVVATLKPPVIAEVDPLAPRL
jgi:hypothetical protein